jgi:threonine-phosphate decarboxylase
LGEAAAKNNLKPEDIIDFSANINFLGPPASITEAIANNLNQIKNYPEINSKSLKLSKLTAIISVTHISHLHLYQSEH